MARSPRKDPLKRAKSNSRQYRKVIYLAPEGHTEAEYFTMEAFRNNDGYVVKSLRKGSDHNSSPSATLKLATEGLKGKRLEKGDQVWMVVDRDDWVSEDLESLRKWASEASSHHLAISSPKFELFLLCHYEDANGCTTSAAVDEHLKRYWPKYDKHVPPRQFSKSKVSEAVRRCEAKRKDSKDDIPPAGTTDAFRLADLLLGE